MRSLFCGLVAAAMLFLVLSVDADTQPPTQKAPVKTTPAKKAAVVPPKRTTTPAGKAAPSKAATTQALASKTGAAKATTSKAGNTGIRTTVAARNAKKASAKRVPAPTWRNRQVVPTPDRYKEIQQALAAKGYLKPEDATGTWDQNSTEALKKFQADQKLETTGKINSLSLIALGLGPKHTAVAASPNVTTNSPEAK